MGRRITSQRQRHLLLVSVVALSLVHIALPVSASSIAPAVALRDAPVRCLRGGYSHGNPVILCMLL